METDLAETETGCPGLNAIVGRINNRSSVPIQGFTQRDCTQKLSGKNSYQVPANMIHDTPVKTSQKEVLEAVDL